MTRRTILLAKLYIFKPYKFPIKYSEAIIYNGVKETEEELDIALQHYFLIKSWNL